MSIERSQGKSRPRPARVDRQGKRPTRSASEAAAPYRDPRTGRFGRDNPGGRLRQLAKLERTTAAELLCLPTDQVAPWLRGHLARAQDQVQRLIDSYGPNPSEDIVTACTVIAWSGLMASAYLAEGSKLEVKDAMPVHETARGWVRELRQALLTKRGLESETDRDPISDELNRKRAEFQANLAERQRHATTLTAGALARASATSASPGSKDAPQGQS